MGLLSKRVLYYRNNRKAWSLGHIWRKYIIIFFYTEIPNTNLHTEEQWSKVKEEKKLSPSFCLLAICLLAAASCLMAWSSVQMQQGSKPRGSRTKNFYQGDLFWVMHQTTIHNWWRYPKEIFGILFYIPTTYFEIRHPCRIRSLMPWDMLYFFSFSSTFNKIEQIKKNHIVYILIYKYYNFRRNFFVAKVLIKEGCGWKEKWHSEKVEQN